MLVAALLLAAQAAPEPPPTPEEVVVIAERMRNVKLSLKTDKKNGGYYCKFKRRSFDPAFDVAICEMAQGCAKSVDKWSQFERCIKPQVEAYARDLVARRKQAAAP